VRIAIVADAHGNLPALDAVLEALAPFDAVWHVGDAVGYGPHPVEVVERLRALDAIGVRGNHDAAALGMIPTDWFNDDARAAIEWVDRQLTPPAREWLAALPERVDRDGFTIVHGSPREPLWEYVLSIRAAAANFEAFDTACCIVGHSHVPLAFRDGERVHVEQPGEGDTLQLEGGRLIVNPGGVGQPRDGDPRAAGVLLDTGAGTLTWRRVEYAVRATQAAMRAAGLPPRLIQRLEMGI
jgi:predicted phosphodiesterase